ncbi:MAG: bifunctional transaldolase/phosoglucose isomerase [Acidobacteria bacterium]|nr:bifunctional transaldolase/phosoglucose isomerase [Acidobacteriota bacterium]
METTLLSCKLPGKLKTGVDRAIEDWRKNEKVRRLWARDASLWTGAGEEKWLGWLEIPAGQMEQAGRFRALSAEIQREKFSHILLLGMGGSSLCPDVLNRTFGKQDRFPEFHVLDSTDPAQIRSTENRIRLDQTLFIVASKSGSTLEPNIFKEYFFERVKEKVGPEETGSRFLAITDPRSALQEMAERGRFRRICFGLPGIGGRYSALSDFGMVPAACMGIDVPRFLAGAVRMAGECAATVPADANPGVILGAVLGVLGMGGRDKVTLITSPRLRALGGWLEQLLAESTGKQGKGLIPVDGEPLGDPGQYGNDRLFVQIVLENDPDADQATAVRRLEEAGHPVVRIPVADPHDLGGEFFRWEFATAVAGSIIGINPFDQPDVEASKIATRELTREYEQKGAFPDETPLLEEDGLALFTDPRNAAALTGGMEGSAGLDRWLGAHLARLQTGDYFALLAYVEMNSDNREILQEIRRLVLDSRRVATCLGFGPRFLHSTGQAYKGGPNSGLFLQLTCGEMEDLPVPGRRYTFGAVKAAQAMGDFQVLSDRQRRVLRVHLGTGVRAGLATLRDRIRKVL